MRDNSWLEARLYKIWQSYFADVKGTNPLIVRFGRNALYRFGSIKLDLRSKISYITINGNFRSSKIPVQVIDHTLAHELVHFTQGFSSKNPRLHRYPHRGGIIDKELKERGLNHLVLYYKNWLNTYRKTLEKS
ncbi:hypothetical protein IID23_04190 [Patescibacteria group bacterium]|nr:hypothetical protein [Patescibacteria group bacterium]